MKYKIYVDSYIKNGLIRVNLLSLLLQNIKTFIA